MNEFDSIIPIELEDLDITIPCNYVLVEYDTNLTKKTPGQIYVSETYADEAGNINRIGTVVVAPKSLYFYRGKNKNAEMSSMRWQTSVEVMKGDKVWINHIESINAYRYTYKGRHFKTIHYQDIVAAKRGDKVIMCNGYVLLREIKENQTFGTYSKDKAVQGRGKIAYFGARNNAYNVPVGQAGSTMIYRTDLEHDLNLDDEVIIFKENYKHVRYLEEETQARFEGREKFLVVQRYMMACIVN